MSERRRTWRYRNARIYLLSSAVLHDSLLAVLCYSLGYVNDDRIQLCLFCLTVIKFSAESIKWLNIVA